MIKVGMKPYILDAVIEIININRRKPEQKLLKYTIVFSFKTQAILHLQNA
jgi:hypothetical protein